MLTHQQKPGLQAAQRTPCSTAGHNKAVRWQSIQHTNMPSTKQAALTRHALNRKMRFVNSCPAALVIQRLS